MADDGRRSSSSAASTSVKVLPTPMMGRTVPFGDASTLVFSHSRFLTSGLDRPPMYKEAPKFIGGVGRTIRWQFAGTDHRDHDPIGVLFTRIADAEAFLRAADSLPAAIAVRDSEVEQDEEEGACASVRVADAQHVSIVVHHVTSRVACGYELDDDGTRERRFEIGIERFDRSDWNFFGQDEKTAAPKQSWVKWDFSWMPEHWTTLPFTWERLAANLDCEAFSSFPLPLRHHVARHRLRDAQGGGEGAPPTVLARARRRRYEAAVPKVPHVIGGLSTRQSMQLLLATHTRRCCPHDDAAMAESTHVLRAYLRYGYTSRVFGPYRQEALHVGHGKSYRVFRKLPQYRVDRLALRVLNRTYSCEEGTLVGRSGRASRSRASAAASKAAKRVMRNDEAYRAQIREVPAAEAVLAFRGMT